MKIKFDFRVSCDIETSGKPKKKTPRIAPNKTIWEHILRGLYCFSLRKSLSFCASVDLFSGSGEFKPSNLLREKGLSAI